MDDTYFMNVALEDARKEGHHFGAVVVCNNKVIATPGKRPQGNPLFHAESEAIRNACAKRGTRDLNDCVLYSTCEPCVMCFYLAWITKIPQIVYGATLQDSIDLGYPELKITTEFLNKRSENKIDLKGSILRKECIALLKSNNQHKH